MRSARLKSKCEKCGKLFFGTSNAKLCTNCKKDKDKERHRKQRNYDHVARNLKTDIIKKIDNLTKKLQIILKDPYFDNERKLGWFELDFDTRSEDLPLYFGRKIIKKSFERRIKASINDINNIRKRFGFSISS